MPPVIIVQAESTTLVAIAVVALTLFVLKRIRARLATAASVAQFEPKVERKRCDVEERDKRPSARSIVSAIRTTNEARTSTRT